MQVINIGDVVRGRDVTSGLDYEGVVKKIVTPLPFSGRSENLYHLDTGARYSDGRLMTIIVECGYRVEVL